MKKFIVLGVVAFLLTLILKTPASLIAQQLEARSDVRLRGVEGTLWRGHARQVQVGDNVLGELQWTVQPWRVLTGRLQGSINLQGDALQVQGQYALSPGNRLTLDETQFDMDAEFVNNLQPYARFRGGRFRGRIDHLEADLGQQQVPKMAGVINWEQGALSSPLALPPGNYQLKVEPDTTGGLVGQLRASEAPVDIQGTVKLASDWRYETDLKVRTTPQGKSLQAALSMIGRPQADGYIPVREKGALR